MELIVGTLVGMILMAAVLSAMISFKKIYANDSQRSELHQNLRSAGSLLSAYIKEAGENLPSTFPAIELTNGTSGASDSLTIRRGLIAEIPKLCQAISVDNLYITNTTPTTGCSYAGNTSNYNAWVAYRTANGGTVRPFIYDIGTKLGEFFNFTNNTNNGTRYGFVKSGILANAYTTTGTSFYLIEQMRFYRNGDRLMLEIDGDTGSLRTVVFGITDFQVNIDMSDGTTKTAFARTDSWNLIRNININILGSVSNAGETFDESYSTDIFPRNILAK